jgi:hypothetical protein
MAPVVLRDGVIKAHMILRDYLGHALISDDESTRRSAHHILVAQFAEVGGIELFDEAMPGILLRPLDNPFDSLRYRHIDSAWRGYFAARVSAVFAPNAGSGHIALLVAALRRTAGEIPRLRLEYRFHGEVPRMMEAVLKHVYYVLSHAAHLIGHYDGLQDSAIDSDARLASQLKEMELAAWFDLYRRDLRALWDRRGEWSCLEEFLALGHHVERLLWPFGLFLWQTSDRNCRVEAPLYVDRQALRIEAQKHPIRTGIKMVSKFARRFSPSWPGTGVSQKDTTNQ